MADSIARLHDKADMARALSLLIEAFPRDERSAYLKTLSRMVAQANASAELLVLEARQEQQRTGVALAQLLIGRTAFIWPIRAVDASLSARLLNELLAALQQQGVVVAQALLSLEQVAEVQLFQLGGFVAGGELIYMSADQETFLSQPPVGELEFPVVAPDDPELARIVAATYQGSLDCPLVDGWREVSDVLAGYRATGTFRPDLWRLIRSQGQTVGCLVLSDFPENGQGELTYVGITPACRGLGLGLAATQWALHLGVEIGWSQLLLAVDAHNGPARRIYRAAGFTEIAVRRLLVRRL